MRRIAVVCALCVGAVGMVAGIPAIAESGVTVSGTWVRFAPPNMKAHAAYFMIKNNSDKERILVGAESLAYNKAEFHLSRMKNGIAMMERQEKVKVPPGKTVEFKSGGLHIMLFAAKQPHVEGDKVPITLIFQNGKRLSVEAIVKKDGMMDHKTHKNTE